MRERERSTDRLVRRLAYAYREQGCQVCAISKSFCFHDGLVNFERKFFDVFVALVGPQTLKKKTPQNIQNAITAQYFFFLSYYSDLRVTFEVAPICCTGFDLGHVGLHQLPGNPAQGVEICVVQRWRWDLVTTRAHTHNPTFPLPPPPIFNCPAFTL